MVLFPLSDAERCKPLLEWFQDQVLSCTSQALTVEGSFNIMTGIIDSGGGKRSVATQHGIQVAMYNQILAYRPEQKAKYSYTRKNLNLFCKTVQQQITRVQCVHLSVTEYDGSAYEAAYFEKFTTQRAKACPKRRKHFSTIIEAERIELCSPYSDSKSNEQEEKEEEEEEEEEEVSEFEMSSEEEEEEEKEKEKEEEEEEVGGWVKGRRAMWSFH
jgi:hypothetical protein